MSGSTKKLGRRDKESTARGGGTTILDSRLGDAFKKDDLALLSSNRDRRSSAVAFSVVRTIGASQLLGVEFKGWKGALSTGLGAKADASCVHRSIVEQDVGSSAKTSTDHARDTVIIECTTDI